MVPPVWIVTSWYITQQIFESQILSSISPRCPYEIIKNSHDCNHLRDYRKAVFSSDLGNMKKISSKFTMPSNFIYGSGCGKVKLCLFKTTCWNLYFLRSGIQKYQLCIFWNIISHKYLIYYFIEILWLPMSCLRNYLQSWDSKYCVNIKQFDLIDNIVAE